MSLSIYVHIIFQFNCIPLSSCTGDCVIHNQIISRTANRFCTLPVVFSIFHSMMPSIATIMYFQWQRISISIALHSAQGRMVLPSLPIGFQLCHCYPLGLVQDPCDPYLVIESIASSKMFLSLGSLSGYCKSSQFYCYQYNQPTIYMPILYLFLSIDVK